MFFIISLSNPIWHIYFLSFVWLHPFIMLNMLLNLRRLWWCYKIGFCQEIKKVAKSLLNTNAQYIYLIHLVASNNVRPKILYFWARRNVIEGTRLSLAVLQFSFSCYLYNDIWNYTGILHIYKEMYSENTNFSSFYNNNRKNIKDSYINQE